jgi:hypothetical protein
MNWLAMRMASRWTRKPGFVRVALTPEVMGKSRLSDI